MKFFITHSQYYDIKKMIQFLIKKKLKKLLQCQSLYLLVRYEHDVQDAINILWIAYSCLGISTTFSLADLIINLLFQVTSFKEKFFITVQINCQSLTNWVGLLYASGIGNKGNNKIWKARFVLLLGCRRNSTGQWPKEEVLSSPAFVSSLSEGQKANTYTKSYQQLTKHELDVA